LVERFLIGRHIHCSRRGIYHFQGLVTKLTTFAISASKHGGQLLNQIFIYSKDITSSPQYLEGWRIFKMTAVTLGRNILSRTHIQGIRIQGIINAVITLIASRSD